MLPTGIDAFADEMERLVPGCRDSVMLGLLRHPQGIQAFVHRMRGHAHEIGMLRGQHLRSTS